MPNATHPLEGRTTDYGGKVFSQRLRPNVITKKRLVIGAIAVVLVVGALA